MRQVCLMYVDSPVSPAGKATRVGGEPGITRAVMSRIQVGPRLWAQSCRHTQMPATSWGFARCCARLCSFPQSPFPRVLAMGRALHQPNTGPTGRAYWSLVTDRQTEAQRSYITSLTFPSSWKDGAEGALAVISKLTRADPCGEAKSL